MMQNKGVPVMVAMLIAVLVGVAQGAEERKLPKLVDQCKTSCVKSSEGDAKKQANCERVCEVIFDGKKKAQDAEQPAPSDEDWRVRYSWGSHGCGDHCL